MAYSLVLGAEVMSDLLTIREKGILMNLLGPQCKLIKTTVAQVLEAKDTEGGRSGWRCLGSGVLCLTENESVRSHFLCLYCVRSAKLLWEQELYIPFQYTAACKYFHTFPADGYYVGFNFADEMEAEEFHLEVKSVQRKQETMTNVIGMTSDQQDEGIKPLDYLGTEQHLPMAAPSIETVKPPLSSDLDPVMRELLMQARLTEEDLKDKDIAEAVDCIISKFGGLQAVQRELRKIESVSQVLPSAAVASIPPALEKGPLPPVPHMKSSIMAQQIPERTEVADIPAGTRNQSPPVPAPFPVVTERTKQRADFKHVGPSVSTERNDLILDALKEVFRKKQLHQE